MVCLANSCSKSIEKETDKKLTELQLNSPSIAIYCVKQMRKQKIQFVTLCKIRKRKQGNSKKMKKK